jgi:pyridoxal phosphate enzyme (YggS family)
VPDIASNITALKALIPGRVKLIAVSKTKSEAEIMEAYNSGQRCFGENRVRELVEKQKKLPPDIEWHFIGHLQTNKVRPLVSFVTMIQSVDSFRLLKVINSEASRCGRIVDCLLQFHIASEETKFGFAIDEAMQMLESEEFRNMKSHRLCGVMGMATFTDNMELVRSEFRRLSGYFNILKNKYFKDEPWFCELSMGMSGDYLTAIEEGSTMVRIGSVIFGERK